MNLITTYAPGRAELLGNHTDYNEGFVLAIAVDRGTTVRGQTRNDRTIHLHTYELDKTEVIALDQLSSQKVAPWSRYILGVVDQFRRNELPVEGFEMEISSNLPLGAGLSSSASVENATLLFLVKAFGAHLKPIQMAHLAQMAEHDFVGVRCGLLDQVTLAHEQGETCHVHRLPHL